MGAMVIGFLIVSVSNPKEPSFQCRHDPMMRHRSYGKKCRSPMVAMLSLYRPWRGSFASPLGDALS